MIKLFDENGRIIQLEKDGCYAHTAILVGKKWMHAGPRNGVEFISSLDDMKLDGMFGPRGFEVDIFYKFRVDRLSQDFIDRFIGKAYDPEYIWESEGAYCSELIARALGIPPSPMKFDKDIWGEDYASGRQELGISPDDLIRPLLLRGYLKFSCPRKIQQKLI